MPHRLAPRGATVKCWRPLASSALARRNDSQCLARTYEPLQFPANARELTASSENRAGWLRGALPQYSQGKELHQKSLALNPYKPNHRSPAPLQTSIATRPLGRPSPRRGTREWAVSPTNGTIRTRLGVARLTRLGTSFYLGVTSARRASQMLNHRGLRGQAHRGNA